MLYLRRGREPGTYEVWHSSEGDKLHAGPFSELEVRRFFRERAIEAARLSVNELLRDVQGHIPEFPTAG